ncbi:MAG: UDP-N-acetylmuramoyl-tripeptide--D-alanyl-D-alanine ligase [Dorea sp.]|nr:UDP-N-acetylmuramoyl-tripeptide--D-alanyl-D-alanine ligase [Dorea sp.]
MKNLTLENITTACRGTYHGDPLKLPVEAEGVVIDSRKVEKNFLFVAIDGEKVNAHKFIPDTIEKGALCVVSHEDLGETDYPYILVESTGQALLDIAKLYRDSFDVKVVGITGSAGKTSTKEMIASVLAQKYNVHKTLGNFNNEWGLPITIFEMNDSHEIAILEMGVNHFGEMRRLSSVASPDICVITNIGVAHLEFFKTREGIFQEKSQMIQDMKNGGTIILNGDDDLLSRMGPVKGVDPVFFGISRDCEFYASDLASAGLKGTACTLHLPSGEDIRCLVPLPGIHMVSNALAGAAVGYSLGLTPEEIKRGIENLPSIPGRNHIISTDKLVILDDCYNANPISTNAAIDVLTMAIGRKVAVLGTMGELGSDEEQLHFNTGVYAAKQGIDLVCGIGRLGRAIAEGASGFDSPGTGSLVSGSSDSYSSELTDSAGTKALWFETKEDFLSAMKDIIHKGDNVLVKASHGMNFPDLVEALKHL